MFNGKGYPLLCMKNFNVIYKASEVKDTDAAKILFIPICLMNNANQLFVNLEENEKDTWTHFQESFLAMFLTDQTNCLKGYSKG